MKRYDVRGTLGYVEKGCRPASSCTPDMYIWFSGFCDSMECIQCLDNPSACGGHKGKRLLLLYTTTAAATSAITTKKKKKYSVLVLRGLRSITGCAVAPKSCYGHSYFLKERAKVDSYRILFHGRPRTAYLCRCV